jgi:hypothetical protein
MIAWATEIKVRAERRCGELLLDLEKRPGNRTDLTSSHDVTRSEYNVALDQIGGANPRQTACRWQKLATIPDEQFEKSVAVAKAVVGEVTTAFLLKQAQTRRRPKTSCGTSIFETLAG